MIRYSLALRQAARLRNLVPEFRRLRQAGQARPGDLPGCAARPRSRRRSWRRRSAAAPGKARAAPEPESRRRRRRARRKQDAGRDGLAAGAGIPRQAQGAARPPDQECRQCRREVSRGSAQDALRRDRASLDLRRGLAARRPRNCSKKASSFIRCRCCRTSGTSAVTAPRSAAARRHDQRDAERLARRRRLLEDEHRDRLREQHLDQRRACARWRRWSSANARNQNSDAIAPMKPANSDGRQARMMAPQHRAVAQREIERQQRRPAAAARPPA